MPRALSSKLRAASQRASVHAAQRGGSWSARRSSRLDSLGSLSRVRRGLTQGEMRNAHAHRAHARPHARDGAIDHVRPPPAFYRTVLRASNPISILRFAVRRRTCDVPGRWATFARLPGGGRDGSALHRPRVEGRCGCAGPRNPSSPGFLQQAGAHADTSEPAAGCFASLLG